MVTPKMMSKSQKVNWVTSYNQNDEGKDLIVTIISAMGEEAAISYKEAPKGSA